MLTDSQLYISPNVYETIQKEPSGYQNLLIVLEPGSHPNYDFAYYELENYPRLELLVNLSEKKKEFLVHSYLFIETQIAFLLKEGLEYPSARELAQHELLEIYSNYNQQPLKV